MDLELLRLTAKIPESLKLNGWQTKYILKRAFRSHLPHEVLVRPKTGFGNPVRAWLSGDLSGLVHELLAPARVKERGLFDPRTVQRLITESAANRADHAYLLYALLNLELWMQTFLDRPGEEITF